MKFPGDPGFEYLDEEEKELIQEIESKAEEMKPLSPARKKRLFAKLINAEVKKQLTLRLNGGDIEAAKKLAEKEGLPYQTLISIVLHKYVTGKLVDIDQAKFVLEKLK